MAIVEITSINQSAAPFGVVLLNDTTHKLEVQDSGAMVLAKLDGPFMENEEALAALAEVTGTLRNLAPRFTTVEALLIQRLAHHYLSGLRPRYPTNKAGMDALLENVRSVLEP